MNRLANLAIGCMLLFPACFRSQEEIKFTQYLHEGERLYNLHCANCHQSNGEGLRNLFPPIKGSEYLDDKASVTCIIRNGLDGSIIVRDKEYNQKMPDNKILTDLEIAEILTFIYANWYSEKQITQISFVRSTLENCVRDSTSKLGPVLK